MRLAIISDIHGNLVALEAVLADVEERSPDVTVNLGDLVTGPLWPRETLDLLATLELSTVRGNHDRWIAEKTAEEMSPSMRFTRDSLSAAQRRWLGGLPATVRMDGVLAVHGTPSSDTEYLLEELVDGRLAMAAPRLVAERLGGAADGLILCGHSHCQHMAAGPRDSVIVNPGSVGCPRYADNEDPFIAEAGSPHARYAVATRRRGRWSVDLVSLDYDWSAVIVRARSHGREDFAAGFLAHRGPS